MSRCACMRCQRQFGLELIATTIVGVWEELKLRGLGETVHPAIAASLERFQRLLYETPPPECPKHPSR